MSRREEVEKKLADIDFANSDYEGNCHAVRPLARTLADEVDSLRASLTALGEKATRYEHEREVNAGLVAERDAVITKLLEMLEPGVAPPKSHQACSCFDCRQHEISEGRYNRAIEIAGRVKP